MDAMLLDWWPAVVSGVALIVWAVRVEQRGTENRRRIVALEQDRDAADKRIDEKLDTLDERMRAVEQGVAELVGWARAQKGEA